MKEAFPGLMDLVSFPEYGLASVITVGWEPGSRLVKRLKIIPGRGRALRPGDRNKLILGKVLAANTGKNAGDTLTIYGERFTVVGVFDSHTVFENGSIFMPLRELQRLMDTRMVTAFSIGLDHPGNAAEAGQVERAIAALDPSLAAYTAANFVDSIDEIKLARSAAWAISAIAILIGAIGMANTMIMSVAERVREIGTLRAIGWTKRRVMSIIFCESLLLSLGGAALGTLAAIGLTRFLSGFPLTSGVIQGQIAPAIMLEGVLVAILVGISGAAYPAFWGASMSPTEAMRRK